jgi:hypothetical protein
VSSDGVVANFLLPGYTVTIDEVTLTYLRESAGRAALRGSVGARHDVIMSLEYSGRGLIACSSGFAQNSSRDLCIIDVGSAKSRPIQAHQSHLLGIYFRPRWLGASHRPCARLRSGPTMCTLF